MGVEEAENQPYFPSLSLELFPANPSYRSGWSFETEARFLKAILIALAPAYAEPSGIIKKHFKHHQARQLRGNLLGAVYFYL